MDTIWHEQESILDNYNDSLGIVVLFLLVAFGEVSNGCFSNSSRFIVSIYLAIFYS